MKAIAALLLLGAFAICMLYLMTNGATTWFVSLVTALFIVCFGNAGMSHHQTIEGLPSIDVPRLYQQSIRLLVGVSAVCWSLFLLLWASAQFAVIAAGLLFGVTGYASALAPKFGGREFINTFIWHSQLPSAIRLLFQPTDAIKPNGITIDFFSALRGLPISIGCLHQSNNDCLLLLRQIAVDTCLFESRYMRLYFGGHKVWEQWVRGLADAVRLCLNAIRSVVFFGHVILLIITVGVVHFAHEFFFRRNVIYLGQKSLCAFFAHLGFALFLDCMKLAPKHKCLLAYIAFNFIGHFAFFVEPVHLINLATSGFVGQDTARGAVPVRPAKDIILSLVEVVMGVGLDSHFVSPVVWLWLRTSLNLMYLFYPNRLGFTIGD